MLDDADALPGPALGSVEDAARLHRRPTRPRPGRRSTGSAAPVAQRSSTAAQTAAATPEAPATLRASQPRAAPTRRQLADRRREQETGSVPTKPQAGEETVDRPMSRIERRRAAERARQAEQARQAEKARAMQEAEERRAAERARLAELARQADLAEERRITQAAREAEVAKVQRSAATKTRTRVVAARSRGGALALPHVGHRARLLASMVLLAVAVVWLLLAFMTSYTVAAGTCCSGVHIGGMSRAEAAAALESAYAAKLARPVTVSADGATAQLSSAAVKAKIDGERSTKGLTGFTLNPWVLWKRLKGGQETQVVVTADPAAVRTELDNHLAELSHGAVSAQVSLVDGKVQQTSAITGTGVDVEAATTMLAASWPVDATDTVALPEGVTEPGVTDAEAHAFTTSVLEPLLAGPVTLTVAGTEAEGRANAQTYEISAKEIISLATVKEEDGALNVDLEPTKLREQILEGFGPAIETQAVGTKWTIDGSEEGAPNAKPELVSAATGKVVDGVQVSKAIVEGVSKSGASAVTRTVTLQLSDLGAPGTGYTSAAEAMGIKEIVGSSDTPFESDPQRDQNLRTGAAAVNGTLILPGQSYSMAQTIGEITPEKGYAEAGVIVGGKHINDIGGGLSQVTTTVFNAAFAAGLEDDEHTPHSQYMSRYPAGLEATLWTGQIDMRFTNSTPYAVLLQAWVGQGQVHVRAWSTRYYDVEISTSDKFNVVQQESAYSSDADCVPNPEGQPGFDITVTRRRSLNGSALPTEVRTVHYEPNNSVTCR
ncbi:VanW family protein [Actinomyces trachealis]|uniref:VanW family protein n=1 Tax=Actinomyces trachealis TaxID=2763540 RepID=UPI001892C182|nr:VanW family protein [Actinomyces trachealis]